MKNQKMHFLYLTKTQYVHLLTIKLKGKFLTMKNLITVVFKKLLTEKF